MTVDNAQPLRMVAMVLAGGRVDELSVLTLHRPKSALPFGGHYRIIDFALSNLMQAGINNVGILSQYRPSSLIDHIGRGESWDFLGLDRGAKILPPFLGGKASDWYRGNADAVYQNLDYVRETRADVVLILSGDHIYSMDYRELVQHHVECGADMTIAFKRMAHDRRFGYGKLDAGDRVVEYVEKPEQPVSDLASLTIYVINTETLIEVLNSFTSRSPERLVSFGRDVLPAMVKTHRLIGYEFTGHWAYTGTVAAYLRAHRDLISGEIDIDRWGIRTNLHDSLVASQPPARFGPHAEVEDSLISTGCEVNGTVVRSVLSPGVRVEEGAHVVDSLLFHNTCIRAGVQIENTITDKHVHVAAGARIGTARRPGASAADPRGLDGAALLGRGCSVGPNAEVGPGSAVPPEVEVRAGMRIGVETESER